MKCYSLFYLVPVVALLAGMAQLRAGWLGATTTRPEPAAARPVQSAAWMLRQVEARPMTTLLRR